MKTLAGLPLTLSSVPLVVLLFSAPPSQAFVIDFQNSLSGAVITDQYSGQGVRFNGGVITQDNAGGVFLRVPDMAHPGMELIFVNPVYSFSAKVYETWRAPDDWPPPIDVDPPPDGPPADDAKPDASIYPTLHLSNGAAVDLQVIHALDEWKNLAFESQSPVARLSLRGHYEPGASPVYFFIDDVSFPAPPHDEPVPEPGGIFLLIAGLAGAMTVGRRLF